LSVTDNANTRRGTNENQSQHSSFNDDQTITQWDKSATLPVNRQSEISLIEKWPECSTTQQYLRSNWQWVDNKGQWLSYDAPLSEALERLYLIDNESKPAFHIEKNQYTVDFSSMMQTNCETGNTRPIRRGSLQLVTVSDEGEPITESGESSCAYPKTWKFDPKELISEFHLEDVFLRPIDSSTEYSEMVELFQKSLPSKTLKSVKRIVNPNLWQSFDLYKKQLEMKRGDTVDVRRLFHGTKAECLDAICAQGFDWRLTGSTTGTLYGKGSYFARDAKYSVDYTDCRKMIVAQVKNLIMCPLQYFQNEVSL
jgi:poly [ADP-ribose] polymerase 7/11/12/13